MWKRCLFRVLCLAVSLTLAGCCGGGKRCTATGTYKDAIVESNGSGKNAQQNAVDGFCMIYCYDHDAVVDAAYLLWKATPDGRASKNSRWIEIDNAPSVKQVHRSCESNCNADRAAGKIVTRTACK